MDALEMTLLFDYYGDLLTERQKLCFDMRYNQDLSDKYLLLEIGYNRNDISEARNTAKFFGRILADTLKAGY